MIRCERLTIAQSGHIVIDAASLVVPAGESLALIGCTGAGKSTLLAALATAIPLHGGEITVHGRSVRRDPAGVRSLIGYVPARLEAWPAGHAADFLELFAVAAGLSGKAIGRALEKALTLAGLSGSDRIDRLSAGAAKRLLIARALLHDPEVLLFDDPFSGLDPGDSRHTERLIGDAAIMGRTVVAAIDDAHVSDCFTHVAVLAEGRITAHGQALPEAFSDGRTWRYRFVCRGQADQAAAVLRPLATEVVAVDSDTVECRIDSARPGAATLIESLVRTGVRLESATYHPHWAAQLIED